MKEKRFTLSFDDMRDLKDLVKAGEVREEKKITDTDKDDFVVPDMTGEEVLRLVAFLRENYNSTFSLDEWVRKNNDGSSMLATDLDVIEAFFVKEAHVC